MTWSLELPLWLSFFWNFESLHLEGYGFETTSTRYGGLHSMLATESFSYLIKSLMSERSEERGSFFNYTSRLHCSRKVVGIGVTLLVISSDIGSITEAIGIEAGLPFNSAIK